MRRSIWIVGGDGWAYDGPSLILACCQCIAHGIDMRFGMKQQQLAVASGYWLLFRYNPAIRRIDEIPFRLHSPRPSSPLKDYAYNEIRHTALTRTNPAEAEELLRMAQAVVTEKYRQYEDLASREGTRFHPPAEKVAPTAQRPNGNGRSRLPPVTPRAMIQS